MEAIPKFPFGIFALALVSRSERPQRMGMIGAPRNPGVALCDTAAGR
jgi:hypothetical protein